jgi:hypothetical protein
MLSFCRKTTQNSPADTLFKVKHIKVIFSSIDSNWNSINTGIIEMRLLKDLENLPKKHSVLFKALIYRYKICKIQGCLPGMNAFTVSDVNSVWFCQKKLPAGKSLMLFSATRKYPRTQ